MNRQFASLSSLLLLVGAGTGGVLQMQVQHRGRPDAALAATGRVYLRENIQYRLDDDCIASLQKFYASAVKLGFIQQAQSVQFYDA